jgi:hypothetical protein
MKRFQKAPSDVIDVDLDFRAYLEPRQDEIASVWKAECDGGIQILSAQQLDEYVVRVRVASGSNGRLYKVAVEVETEADRRRRHEVLVKVIGGGVVSLPPVDGGDLSADFYQPIRDTVVDGGEL